MTFAPFTWQHMLLTELYEAGGSKSWADLSQGQCMRGTRLEQLGMCVWSSRNHRGRLTRDSRLVITPIGLRAIGRDAA